MSTDTDVRTIIELEALPAALASLAEAAIQKPGDAALQVSLAAAALQAGRIHIFETALAKALEIDPQNLPALQLLAKLNFEMGNVANAAKTYFKILQQDKINVEALLGLGLCFFKQGNQDMARKSFERVLRQQPNHLLAQENLRAMQSPIVVTSHPSKPDYSNLIDLKPFFEGVDDYAVLKLPEHFPNYRDHSDLDILCRDHRSFLRHIQRCAKSYAERGFKVQVHAEQGHCHVDFYAPGATRLNFRFDLMESLVDFAKFSVSPVFEKGVLDYRREVVQNSVRVLVPRLTDDLAVRCLEYLAWRDVRPEKIAHWHYLERAGNWQFLEVVSRHTNLNLSVDIASGRRPVLKASQKPQRRPAEVTAVTEMLKPVSRASPMTLEEYLAPENCDTTIASRRPRLDYFMIWGHGTRHTREILEIIRRQKSVEIVAIHKKFVADIAKFVSDIYSSDAVPLEHLAAKTRYLLKTPPEIVLILTRNLDPQERFYGEGAFRHIQCARIKAIKEDIRDQCNPRQDGKRMEDHVIHASDFESQTEHVLEILSLPPAAYFTRRPNRDLDGPYHLPPFENYALHEVPLESLRANILGQGLVPIIQTPHYRYVRGEQESYRAYHAAHFGKEFTDDHLPENFDRLMASFDSSRFSEIGNKSFIVAVKEPDQNYRILDGVHRAAILQHRNVKSVLIVEPLYNDVSRAGANQVLTAQPASRVGTARRAVRGRLGEATLPKSDLPPSRAPQNDESSPPVKRFKAAALVFSKDRPLQLDGALRSWKRHCRDAATAVVKVLYKASSSRILSLYARLQQEHPDVDFVREGDFRRDVLTLLRDENYVLFAVDDTVFIRDFAMADFVKVLDSNPKALGFSLRLGRNTTDCYSMNHAQNLPEFEPVEGGALKFRWPGADYDFSYPLEVSSSVYRGGEMLRLLEQLVFKNPNTLEDIMSRNAARFSESHPFLFCSPQSAAFSIPANKVQQICDNRAGGNPDYSAEALAALFAKGQRMQTESFDRFIPKACHQEVDLQTAPEKEAVPLVSVIVPCYNQSNYLPEAVASVLAQTFADWELIIVNDGSPDDTGEVARKLIKENPGRRIRLLEKKNGGLADARNTGIGAAAGAYILPLDADDKIEPAMLAKTVAVLEENPAIAIAYTDAAHFGAVDKIVPAGEFDLQKLCVNNQLNYCSLFRREAWERAGGYKPGLCGYEDWDFWITCAELRLVGRKIPNALFQYRVKESSMFTDALAQDKALRARIVLHHPTLYDASQRLAAREIWSDLPLTLSSGAPKVSVIVPAFNRSAGYSFCLITNGKRPKKLAAEIASIRALKIPVYEILVGGDLPRGLEGVIRVPMPEAAKAGRLGGMRNRLIDRSRYDHLVIADDDLLFERDFYDGLRQYGENYEVLCVRFLNLDGTRFWDWATIGGPTGHHLLEYDQTDPHVYVTGGLCIMKAAVAERVRWDEHLGFYQKEDVEFSRRLHEAGISIRFNRFSAVIHTDARYSQVGSVVKNIQHLREHMLRMEREGRPTEALDMARRLRTLEALGAGDEIVNNTNAARVTLPVRWRGPVFDPCGYATEAINYLLPLADQVDLGLSPLKTIYSEKYVAGLAEKDRTKLFALRDKFAAMSGGIVIDHAPAYCFNRLSDADYQIGRTMFETDRIPRNWVVACNQMDEIWVPSQFNVETFASSGVERDKLVVMPQSLDANEFDPAKHQPLPLPNRAAFNFLSVFVWSVRKGWDVLLSSYLREFSAEDDVCLYLRTYLVTKPDGNPTEAIERLIREHAAALNLGNKPLPRIQILAEQTAQVDLPRLYKAADCLVAPSRGEGWGRPHHEAMMMGLPVIATNWSGNTEFMNRENSYLLDYELGETRNLEASVWLFHGQRWANPSEKHLRELMRRAQQKPDEARAKGRLARQHMVRHYSRLPVTDLMVARLREIERKLTTPACPAVTARSLELPEAPVAHSLRVAWEGSFLDLGSLSHTNREMTRALGGLPKLQLTRVSQEILPPALAQQSEMQKVARSLQPQPPGKVAITVRHAWPPNWQPPASGAWVMFQPWEYGVLPAEWAERIKSVDEVWAPSEYVRRVYVDSGVDPKKVKIVPHGVDAERFQPTVAPMKLATRKTFKFLFVGGTIHRKGPDVLLEAYLNSFTAADDVCLVIKDFGGKSVYMGQTLENQIKAAQSQPGAPEILFLNEELPADAMPGLYTACDCLVHPYRGEGFGFPVLEAMACGLPVILTGGGATDDFAGDEHAWRIPARRRLIGLEISGMKLVRSGWLLEPDPSALAEKMKWVAGHREEARRKGRAASEYVRREWTWQRAAQIASHRLHDLSARLQAQADALTSRHAAKTTPLVLPETAKVGQLGHARELLRKKDFRAAWNHCLSALMLRPFHCEAFLLLAEIAQTAGDMTQARVCAERARRLAPDWKPARKFLKSIPARGGQSVAWPSLPEIPASPRLTVCLITKNEEKFLEQCLQSICEMAHQIIVVDTGSTDRTVEIAKKFNAQVHSFPWNDDFSAARNEALRHATGDWVLSLDADEELLPGHHATLLREMQAPAVMGYRLPIIDKGREREGRNHVPRLFRNAPGLFFVGRVHEQVFSSLAARCEEWGLQSAVGQTALLHHGYLKEVMVSRDKIARNLRLLQLALEDMPGDTNLLMNLGLELVRSGHLKAGLDQYIEALNGMSVLPRSQIIPEVREALLSQMTTHLLADKDFAKVIEVFNSPAARAGGLTASHHFGLGLAFMELRQPAEGAEHMRQCLAKRGESTLTHVNPDILGSGPHHCLALCLMALQQKDAAGHAFAAAFREDSTARPLRFDFARFQADSGQPVEALKLLNALAAEDPKETRVWEFGGQVALSRPDFLEFACDWTATALQHFSDHPALMAQRAEALFLTQDFSGALPLWCKARSANPARQLAAIVLCEFLAGDCARKFAPSDEALVSREAVKWYRQLIAVGARGAVKQLHERMERVRRVLPGFARVWDAANQQARAHIHDPVKNQPLRVERRQEADRVEAVAG